MKTAYKCSCGEHHEVGPANAFHIQTVGPNIRIKSEDGMWWVPRVYLIVHGRPTAQDLVRLAEKYKWKSVKRPANLRSVSA